MADDRDDQQQQQQMLAEAIARARKLLAELERQQWELETSPPSSPPHDDLPAAEEQQLAQGRQAFDSAIAAARRMLKALEDAAAT